MFARCWFQRAESTPGLGGVVSHQGDVSVPFVTSHKGLFTRMLACTLSKKMSKQKNFRVDWLKMNIELWLAYGPLLHNKGPHTWNIALLIIPLSGHVWTRQHKLITESYEDADWGKSTEGYSVYCMRLKAFVSCLHLYCSLWRSRSFHHTTRSILCTLQNRIPCRCVKHCKGKKMEWKKWNTFPAQFRITQFAGIQLDRFPVPQSITWKLLRHTVSWKIFYTGKK